MFVFSTVKVRNFERALLFKDKEFIEILSAGRYWFFDPLNKIKVDVVSQRDPWLVHPDLDAVVTSGLVDEGLEIIDLQDHERALVWVDGRFDCILEPGLYAIWKSIKRVKVEIIDAYKIRFEHAKLPIILNWSDISSHVKIEMIPEGYSGLYYQDGKLVEVLGPGEYAFWKNIGQTKMYQIDTRESVLEITGQDIISADKVSLRMNAVLTYQVLNASKAVSRVEDFKLALYRMAQLALRAVVGTKDLDVLLSEKDSVADEMEQIIKKKSSEFGVEILSMGIRDIILPGEMKDLLNKVTEAKKAMEANLITRREETAAMRSQVNTAKLLDNNPTLMRLKELEVLEKVISSTNMSIVLDEKGLTDKVVNLL